MGYLTNAPAPALANLASLDARYNGMFDKLSEGWQNPQVAEITTDVAIIEFPVTRGLYRVQGFAVPNGTGVAPDTDLVMQVRRNGAWVTTGYHYAVNYADGATVVGGQTINNAHYRVAAFQQNNTPTNFECQGNRGTAVQLPYFRTSAAGFARDINRPWHINWGGYVTGGGPIDRIRFQYNNNVFSFAPGTRMIFEEM